MKRSLKNIIICLLIAAVGACSAFTVKSALNQQQSNPFPSQSQQGDFQMQQPPEMPSGDNSQQPPEMPSGDNSQQPPEMPNGEKPEMPSGDSSDSSSSERPEMPSGDSSDSSSSEKPEMPSGEGFQPPDMTDKKDFKGKGLSSVYYAALAAESFVIAALLIYLIMSGFNKKGFKETFSNGKRIAICALSVLIITGALTAVESKIAQKNSFNPSQIQSSMTGEASSVSASGATTVESEETLSASYSSTESDESAILVTNGGNATVDGASITKSGDSTNTENSEFYGVNAGILVQENSTATIKNAEISTDAKGANAVFSTGENSKIYISNSTIKTTGESSARGLDATYGGYIEADKVSISTQGGSCAALATDRGEGTVIAKNSTLETNGSGSPVIYSTGDISIESSKGTANGSQMVVIEGKNSATVTDSTLVASAKGNRGETDKAGIMIYQSMSGDASEGTGTFTAKNSSLEIASDSDYFKSAPMFFITNTDAVINLTNTNLTYGSGVLISAKGTDEWGTSGSNGGNVTLNAENQTLAGNIEADSISTVSLSLKSSTYEGTINGENSAKEVKLTLDNSSKIKLTGDSYVTSFEGDKSNIDFNGFTLYVNGVAIN